MAYQKTLWKARQGTNLEKFAKHQETANTVILVNTPDAVTQQGTPFSPENMNKIEQGIYDAHERIKNNYGSHATMVDGLGRDLRLVFGITSTVPAVYIPLIMAEIRRRCNNNGEINSTGIPDFDDIRIGDYIDGMSLDGIAAPTGGTATQAWNDTYKNNRIVVSGFNTYKNAGDTENTKNHILFTFRHCIATGRMNSTSVNAGGYRASELRIWLEGINGDGSGAFATKLKTVMGGNYLYTIRKLHSVKGSATSNSFTVFLLSEPEVLGNQTYGDELSALNTNIHIPIFSKSYVHLIKRRNGSRQWWWLQTPSAASATDFCVVGSAGNASYSTGANAASGGVAPAFCVA